MAIEGKQITREHSNESPLDWRYKSVRHNESAGTRANSSKLKSLLSSLIGNRKVKPNQKVPRDESEGHHNYNGRPWCLGLDHHDYLVSRGLQPEHKFLDIGCGALRTGIHIIDHLNSDNYFGIDGHKAALDVAVRYEVPMNRLEHKAPSFLHSSSFELEKTATSFDWIFAFAVVNHLNDTQINQAFNAFHKVLKPGGRLVLSPKPRVSLDEIEEKYGFTLTHQEVRPCRLIESEISWFEFALMDANNLPPC